MVRIARLAEADASSGPVCKRMLAPGWIGAAGLLAR